MERNFRDRVKVHSIHISYKGEEMAYIDEAEIKMGLLDLLSYLIKGKTTCLVSAVNGEIKLSQGVIDSFSNSKNTEDTSKEVQEQKKAKYSFILKLEDFSLSILDKWSVDGISASLNIDERVDKLNASLNIPKVSLVYNDYSIGLDEALISLSLNNGFYADVTLSSLALSYLDYSLFSNEIKGSITSSSISSIEDMNGSISFDKSMISFSDGEVLLSPISATINNGGADIEINEINGRYQDISIDLYNASLSTNDYESVNARIESINGKYRDIPFSIKEIEIPSFNLEDKEANAGFKSLSVVDLENISNNILSALTVNDCSLSLSYENDISLAFGFNSIISPRSKVTGDMYIGFDINLDVADNKLKSFNISSRDIYLGYGDKRDNSLSIKGDYNTLSLLLEYGKINLDLLLGLQDYDISGTFSLSDYPISTIYTILSESNDLFGKYIPSSSKITCDLIIDGKLSKENMIPFIGNALYSVDLSNITFGIFESFLASKGEVSFTENGVNFSPLSLETKDFSLNLNGNLPYSSMLPSLDFSVLLPDETEALKGFLTLKSDDTYDYSFVFTTFDDTSLLGKVFFQNGEITGNSTLTTLGIKRPFIFNVDLNNNTFGASSSKVGLTGSFTNGVEAKLMIRRLDLLRDGKGKPMLVEGDINLSINKDGWSVKGEGINLENNWFIPTSPNISFDFFGNEKEISIPRIDILSNDTKHFAGKVFFDMSTFDLSGTLDAQGGEGDIVFSFSKDELYSGFIRVRDLDLTPFGIKDMYANVNLTGRASRLADISLEGKIESLSYDSVNDTRKLTADISINSDSLLLDNIKFTNSGFSIEIDSINWKSTDGVLKIGEGRFSMKGEHADRPFPITAAFDLSLMLNNDDNLYYSLFNILRDGGEDIKVDMNLKTLDIDNSRILVENKNTIGLIKDRILNFNGSLISGWFDFDSMSFDMDLDVMPLASFSIKGVLKDGINANVVVNSFNMYFVNTFMDPPLITFDECYVKGEAGILEKDGIYNMNGYLAAEEIGVNIFWVPDQKVVIHNPTFTLWNNDLRSSISKATVIDYTTYERKSIDIYAGLTLTPTLSIDGYCAEIWMDEENTVRIRLPLPEMGIDILANGYGHYIMTSYEGEAMTNDGELSVVDSVVTIGMNPYPEWYNLEGYADVDLILNFKRNNRIIYPAQSDPILSITLDENSSVKFVKKGDDISVQGDVDIRGGEIFYFQKYFYITEGNISFPDPNKLDPKINLKATLRTYDSDSNRVEVYLVMKDNTFNNFNPTLESSPAKDLNEIMEILGQSILPSSTYGTVSVGSVTQLVTEGIDILGRLGIVTTSNPVSGMSQSLKEFFGVDSFSLHSNIVNNILSDTISNSLTDNYSSYSPMARYLDGTTLNIGKYLSSNFYLQGMIHLSANKNNKDKYTFISDDLVLDTEFSLEWMNPAFKITFTTSPSYFSLFSVMDTFRFSISKTINF